MGKRIANKIIGDDWEIVVEDRLLVVERTTRLLYDRQVYEVVNNNIRYIDNDISDSSGERFAIVEVKGGANRYAEQIHDHISLAADSVSKTYILVTPDGTTAGFSRAVTQELQGRDVKQLVVNGDVVSENSSGRVTVVVTCPEHLPELLSGLCDGKSAADAIGELLDRERAEREAQEQAEREAQERAEREAQERAEREAQERAEREAQERAEREAQEQTEREAQERAEHEAQEQVQREGEASQQTHDLSVDLDPQQLAAETKSQDGSLHDTAASESGMADGVSEGAFWGDAPGWFGNRGERW